MIGILDVRVKLASDEQLDIEMQVRYFEYWDECTLFYLCKMMAEQLEKGGSYGDLQKCIHVSILDFIHYPEDEFCYRTIRLVDEWIKNASAFLLRGARHALHDITTARLCNPAGGFHLSAEGVSALR